MFALFFCGLALLLALVSASRLPCSPGDSHNYEFTFLNDHAKPLDDDSYQTGGLRATVALHTHEQRDDGQCLFELKITEPRPLSIRAANAPNVYQIDEDYQQKLSRPFFFLRRADGSIGDVFLPADETPMNAMLKKGLASCFQVTAPPLHLSSRGSPNDLQYRAAETDELGTYSVKYTGSARDGMLRLSKRLQLADYTLHSPLPIRTDQMRLQLDTDIGMHWATGVIHSVSKSHTAQMAVEPSEPAATFARDSYHIRVQGDVSKLGMPMLSSATLQLLDSTRFVAQSRKARRHTATWTLEGRLAVSNDDVEETQELVRDSLAVTYSNDHHERLAAYTRPRGDDVVDEDPASSLTALLSCFNTDNDDQRAVCYTTLRKELAKRADLFEAAISSLDAHFPSDDSLPVSRFFSRQLAALLSALTDFGSARIQTILERVLSSATHVADQRLKLSVLVSVHSLQQPTPSLAAAVHDLARASQPNNLLRHAATLALGSIAGRTTADTREELMQHMHTQLNTHIARPLFTIHPFQTEWLRPSLLQSIQHVPHTESFHKFFTETVQLKPSPRGASDLRAHLHSMQRLAPEAAVEKTLAWLRTEASCDVVRSFVPSVPRNEDVAAQAILYLRALGNAGQCDSLPAVRNILAQHCFEDVRRAAVNALRYMPCEAAQELLISSALNASEPIHIRRAGVQALRVRSQHLTTASHANVHFHMAMLLENVMQMHSTGELQDSSLLVSLIHYFDAQPKEVSRPVLESLQDRLPGGHQRKLQALFKPLNFELGFCQSWSKIFGGTFLGAGGGLTICDQGELYVGGLGAEFSINIDNEAYIRGYVFGFQVNVLDAGAIFQAGFSYVVPPLLDLVFNAIPPINFAPAAPTRYQQLGDLLKRVPAHIFNFQNVLPFFSHNIDNALAHLPKLPNLLQEIEAVPTSVITFVNSAGAAVSEVPYLAGILTDTGILTGNHELLLERQTRALLLNVSHGIRAAHTLAAQTASLSSASKLTDLTNAAYNTFPSFATAANDISSFVVSMTSYLSSYSAFAANIAADTNFTMSLLASQASSALATFNSGRLATLSADIQQFNAFLSGNITAILSIANPSSIPSEADYLGVLQNSQRLVSLRAALLKLQSLVRGFEGPISSFQQMSRDATAYAARLLRFTDRHASSVKDLAHAAVIADCMFSIVTPAVPVPGLCLAEDISSYVLGSSYPARTATVVRNQLIQLRNDLQSTLTTLNATRQDLSQYTRLLPFLAPLYAALQTMETRYGPWQNATSSCPAAGNFSGSVQGSASSWPACTSSNANYRLAHSTNNGQLCCAWTFNATSTTNYNVSFNATAVPSCCFVVNPRPTRDVLQVINLAEEAADHLSYMASLSRTITQSLSAFTSKLAEHPIQTVEYVQNTILPFLLTHTRNASAGFQLAVQAARAFNDKVFQEVGKFQVPIDNLGNTIQSEFGLGFNLRTISGQLDQLLDLAQEAEDRLISYQQSAVNVLNFFEQLRIQRPSLINLQAASLINSTKPLAPRIAEFFAISQFEQLATRVSSDFHFGNVIRGLRVLVTNALTSIVALNNTANAQITEYEQLILGFETHLQLVANFLNDSTTDSFLEPLVAQMDALTYQAPGVWRTVEALVSLSQLPVWSSIGSLSGLTDPFVTLDNDITKFLAQLDVLEPHLGAACLSHNLCPAASLTAALISLQTEMLALRPAPEPMAAFIQSISAVPFELVANETATLAQYMAKAQRAVSSYSALNATTLRTVSVFSSVVTSFLGSAVAAAAEVAMPVTKLSQYTSSIPNALQQYQTALDSAFPIIDQLNYTASHLPGFQAVLADLLYYGQELTHVALNKQPVQAAVNVLFGQNDVNLIDPIFNQMKTIAHNVFGSLYSGTDHVIAQVGALYDSLDQHNHGLSVAQKSAATSQPWCSSTTCVSFLPRSPSNIQDSYNNNFPDFGK